MCTRIKVKEGTSPPIEMKVGVKQGDPMSPLLFNIAVDPLTRKLESMGEGYRFGGEKVTTLAFADDLVLMSSSWAGMQHNIKILESLSTFWPTCAAKKVPWVHGETRGVTFTVNNCQAWTIEGEKLHLIDPDKSEKYLGMKVNPWLGISKPDLRG